MPVSVSVSVSEPSSDGGFVELLVEFAGALRDAGLPLGTDDVLVHGAAVASLDPTDILDLYWAGRTALVHRRDHIPVYDNVFRQFFLDERPGKPPSAPRELLRTTNGKAVLELPEPEPGTEGEEREQEITLGRLASGAETVRAKAFSACTADELAALRRIIATVRLTPPRRRTRRRTVAPDGRTLHVRHLARQSMRRHGEVPELRFVRRKQRLRPLVLLLDVSGSMSDYSRNLLQFAYSTRRASGRVEVFCFGTRLTRITHSLARRRPDDALASAAARVFDWDGGTRIGWSIDAFVRGWGRRGLARGAIVVICSDGLDRGDPAVLDKAMEQLARLCHRIVWLNPHQGDAGELVPSSLGMIVAAPYVDRFWSGHNLASLEDFAARLPELG